MTRYELVRYLSYCSEMLSLASKAAAVYGEKIHDPAVVDAVGDIERLTTNLSQKIWQKITLVETDLEDVRGAAAVSAGELALSRERTASGRMSDLIALLTTFTGRISRRQWWIGFVIVCVGNVLGGLLLNPDFFLAETLPPPSWPDTLWQIAMLYPATAITVKRFNDRDRPAWLGYAFAPIGALLYLAPHFGQVFGPQSTAILMILFWASPHTSCSPSSTMASSAAPTVPTATVPDPLARSAQPA